MGARVPHEFPMRTSNPIISGVSSSSNIFVISSAQGGEGGGQQNTSPLLRYSYILRALSLFGVLKKLDQIINK